MMNRVPVFLIAFTLCIGMINASNEKTVVFINRLGSHKTLRVHCKSKDNDLGYQYVKPGQKYDFSFGDNFFKTTLFWCHLRQGPHYKHHLSFVAYKSSWSDQAFMTIKWIATEGGMYYTQNLEDPVFKFGWDVPLNVEGEKIPAE